MTDWIVSNAWWFAPTLAFAGVGMFVGALLWPRKATPTGTVNVDAFLLDAEEFLTQLDAATHRRGKHLRTD